MHYVTFVESLSKLQIVLPRLEPTAERSPLGGDTLHAAQPASLSHDAAATVQQPEMLRRLAASGVDLIGCLALMIKHQWEDYQRLKTSDTPYTSNSQDAPSPELPERLGFVCDSETLFALVQREQGLLESAGYSEQVFKLICRELTSAKLFWGDIDSPELNAFRHRQTQNLRVFANASDADVASFRRKKLFWLEVYDQLGEKILVLEQLKLRSEEVNRRFMAEFGEAHLDLEQQLLRLDEAGLRVEYIRSHPGASRDDIENAVADRIATQREHLRRLKHAVFMAPYLQKSTGGASVGENDFLDHRATVKRRLLEIRMILHPDRLAHQPGYAELSDDQKERLKALWHELQQVTPEETGYAEDQLGAFLRSLTLLDNILKEANAILAHPGIDTDVHLIPQGDSLDEQLAWLDEAIDWIDQQTACVIAEVHALERDDTFRKREALLACNLEKKAQVRAEMESLSGEYAREAAELEEELAQLLAEVEHDHVE